jgi:hypothetical protein
VTPRARAASEEFLGRDFSDLELPDKAINLNLRRIQGPEDFKKATSELVNIYRNEINEARRGVITQEQTARMAEDLGMTPEQLLSRQKGKALNAEEITAARKMNRSILEEWSAAADRVRTGRASEQEKAEFVKLTALAEGSLQNTLGATAEAGRALQAMRIKVGPSAGEMRMAREMIGEFRAGGEKNVEDFATLVSRMDSPQGLSKLALEARKATTVDKLVEVWINGLLSGPQTHAVNILSNGIVSFYTVPETYLAGAAGAGRNMIRQAVGGGRAQDRVFMREGTERLLGIAQGARDGLIVAGKTFAGGEGFDPTTKLETMRHRNIKGPLGEIVRIPGRALVSADEFFKAIGRRQELNALATRDGTNKGLTGRALSRHIKEFVRTPPKEAMESAVHAARVQTFTELLGQTGQGAQQLFSSPVGRVIVPFVRTPTNIFKFALARTPAGLAMKDVRSDIKTGGAKRDTALARIGFSSSIGAWVASEAASGNITGSGPSDPGLRATWFADGNRPYSIRIPARFANMFNQQDVSLNPETGDMWVSYARLEPIGTLLGVAADFAEISGHIEEKGSEELAAKITIAINRNIANKTFISGMSAAAMAIADPDRHGPRFYQRLAGTLIPTGLAQLERSRDPILREVQSATDQIKSRIPGYSTTLNPRLNIWGEPIFLDGGLGPDLVSPLYSSRKTPDKASSEAWRLRVKFSKPSKKVGKVDLTPDEHHELVKQTGQTAKRAIDLLVNTEYWDAMPIGMQRETMRFAYDTARRIARNEAEARMAMTQPERVRGSVREFIEPFTQGLGQLQSLTGPPGQQ